MMPSQYLSNGSPHETSTSQFLLLRIMPYDLEYPFGQLGLAVLAVSLSIFLYIPSLLTGGAV